MHIRLLTAADEDVLARVAPDVFDDPLVRSSAAQCLADDRHHLVVAIDDGIVVGFVSAVHYAHPDKVAPELWINEVGVAATHQRQGLGGAMLQAVLDHARTLGCREAWVLTDAENEAANRLYGAVEPMERTEGHVMYTFPLLSERPRDDR